MNLLTAEHLTLWRGHRCLFSDLGFAIEAGGLGLVRGPNGSGKTTLLRVLAGLTRPESGQVSWRGVIIDHDRIGFGAQMSYLGHAAGLKADLTVQQNLDFARRINGQKGDSDESVYAALSLENVRALPVRYLSAGQQRRVALARVLSSSASLWLMDEPLTNLDSNGRLFVARALERQLLNGGAAVVATHSDLEVANATCVPVELGERG